MEESSMWNIEGVLDDFMSDIASFFWGVLADLLDVFAGLVESMPVPEFIAPLAGFVGSVPPGVIYFVSPFELSYGLQVIGAALAARLLLSLVPFVGGAFR